jgi:uncharacterized protein YfaS (alpha-2-macroglobulin family)
MNIRAFILFCIGLLILAAASAMAGDVAPNVLIARVPVADPALAGEVIHYKVITFDGRTLASGRSDVTRGPKAAFTCAIPIPTDPAQRNDALAGMLLARVVYDAPSTGKRVEAFLEEALPVFSLRYPDLREVQAGTRTSVRFIAVHPSTGAPVSGVRLVLDEFSNGLTCGRTLTYTDAEGAASFSMRVASKAKEAQSFTVKAEKDGWTFNDRLSFEVGREARAFLQTDKPLYQPSQIIHIRALVFKAFQKKPDADRPVTILVSDPKDNKVFRKEVKANAYGLVWTDFSLADEVILGTYKISLLDADGNAFADRNVEVSRYVLPKFKVTLKPDKPYYKPGEKAHLTISARYFFGKPVSGGTVKVTTSQFIDTLVAFGEHEVKLDDRGEGTLEAELPERFYGTPFDQGKAFVLWEASAEDTAGQQVQSTLSTPVVPDPVSIHLITEAGPTGFKAGLSNRIYLILNDPMGGPLALPVRLTLKQNDKTWQASVQSNVYGIAAYETPALGEGACTLSIKTQSPDGTSVERAFTLSSEGSGEAIVIRSVLAQVRAGELLSAFILASKREGRVYWDVLKDKQVMLAGMGRLSAGRYEFSFPASPDFVGDLLLRAYTYDAKGNILHHEVPVIVAPPSDLNVNASFDRSEYRPGGTATALLHLTDGKGNPKQGALGAFIVDEAVFALADLHPGLEKVYFLLEEEIMKPRYEIHGIDLQETALEVFESKEKRGQAQEALKAVLQLAQTSGAPAFADSYARQMTPLRNLAEQKYAEHVNKIGQKIVRALEGYKRITGNCPAPERAIRELLRKKLITAEESKDRWGRVWVLSPFNSAGLCEGGFSVTSFGPDGKNNTGDERAWYIYDEKRMRRDKMQKDEEGFGMAFDRAVPMAMPALQAAKGGVLNELQFANESGAKEKKADGGSPEPRVRRSFPETMFYLPFLETGPDGKVSVQVPLADSITTWRAVWFASTRDGLLGSATVPLKVFQPFFVDLDLPLYLTKGDEVHLPVVVYNYTQEERDVRLVLSELDGLDSLGEKEKVVTLSSGQVLRFYFPVRASVVGTGRILLKAYSGDVSDAIEKTVPVVPNGREIRSTKSGVLSAPVEVNAGLPEHALSEGARLQVLLFPSYFSQAIDGLDKIFRMPGGCFEQTSSSTYPNVLALQYLEKSRKTNPELTMKAEGFINHGYQRLLTFEVQGGGFSWFGNPPANKILTAYGLMEFSDMAKVHSVDARLLERTAAWLASRQSGDGSWTADTEYIAEGAVNRFLTDPVRITAYIAWSLVYSGNNGPAVDKALGFIGPRLDKVEDPYTLALLINLYADRKDGATAGRVASKLAGMAVRDGKKITWKESGPSPFYSTGEAGSVEITGLAAMGFMKLKQRTELVQGAMEYLIGGKDSWGTWWSTQSTVMALKALIFALENGAQPFSGTVRIYVDNALQKTLAIEKKDSDLTFSWSTTENLSPSMKVRLEFDGQGSPLYQIVTSAYVPWAFAPKGEEPVRISVNYDRTRLTADDTLSAKVKVENTTKDGLKMLIVDLGVPPGFSPSTEDLEVLKAKGSIQRYQLTGWQIILYLDGIAAHQTLTFTYRLEAKYPVKVQGAEARVYEYYNPQNETRIQQESLVVSE